MTEELEEHIEQYDDPSLSELFGLADGWVDYITILCFGPFGLVYGLFERHLGAFVFGVATTLMYIGLIGLLIFGIDAIVPILVDVINWLRPVVFGFAGMVRESIGVVRILVLVFVVGLLVALSMLWVALPLEDKQ